MWIKITDLRDGGGEGHALLGVHKKCKCIYFGLENSENLLNTGQPSFMSSIFVWFGLIEAHALAPGIVQILTEIAESLQIILVSHL